MERPKNTHTFIGCDSGYDESSIVLYGAPFDGTASYRPGARFACGAIRNESYGIETYSPYLDRDLSEIKVYDSGDLEVPPGGVLRTLEMIEEKAESIMSDRKVPIMIGGEHLVTLGAVRACAEMYDNLHIVHFDAHADFRHEYLGIELSHATVMRRCWELVGDGHIHQYGIRSGDKEEFLFTKEHAQTVKYNFNGIEELTSSLREIPVYLTVDLDVLDPSVFPGTGTPEAGGVSFSELHTALKTVLGLNVVALDITELAPPLDISGASTALACKLLREILLMI